MTQKYKNRLFISKRVHSIEDLRNNFALEENLEIRIGKNKQTTFSQQTKLLIVGTAIPAGIPYFFTGKNSNLYLWIDEARHTNIKKFVERIRHSSNENEIENCVRNIKNILSEQKIAFLDITDAFLTLNGSNEDDKIKNYVIDKEAFEKVQGSKNVLIVPISRYAEAILKEVLLFNEENVRYTHYFRKCKKSEWIELFESTAN